MSTLEVTLPDGEKTSDEDILTPWKKRRDAARRARKPFEGHWMENQAFAAGYQWVEFSPRDHRAIDIAPLRRQKNRSDAKADVLTQYVWTAIGKFAKDDFRPQLLFQHSDEEGQNYAEGANKAFGWGWDEEWQGDEVLLNLLLTLATFGTGAVRCRYDKTRGPLVGDMPVAPDGGYKFTDPQTSEQHAFEPGQPIMHLPAARAYVGEAKYYGEQTQMRSMREGAVVWELLSPWNLLPPPAIESERDFPWHLIVRPVHLDTVKSLYPERGAEVTADELEAMNVLGLKDLTGNVDPNTGFSASGSDAKLEDHALVYTGYEEPCAKWPKGATITFTHDGHLLDFQPNLPLNEAPHGPRAGMTYFHYWKVKQRFWGRGLYDAGKGPQRIRNKRLAQQDEIIDRTLPKVYEEEGAIVDVPSGLALERVMLRPGAAKPQIDNGPGLAPHFKDDIELQDLNIEKALGLHSVSLGGNSSASAPYARIALESENDADKLDPIAKDFKLGVADISRDALESMRNWPDGKLLLIAGEDERLEALTFERSQIPATFMVKPPKGSSIPRSQGAELQKVNDLWEAALAAQAVGANPAAWLEWYKTSLDDGKADELPALELQQQQRHKAALENVVMARTGQPLPVAPYDDANIHMGEHGAETERLSAAMIEAPDDPSIGAALAAVQQHSLQHEMMQAQAMPVPGGGGLPVPPQAAPPQLPPGMTPPGAPPA